VGCIGISYDLGLALAEMAVGDGYYKYLILIKFSFL
jgi:hypothetical protein